MKKKNLFNGVMTLAILMAFFGVVLATPALAVDVSFTWTPPTTNSDGTPLTDLAGYRMHKGTAPGVYDEAIDVGNVTAYTWGLGDVEGVTLYFNVTAYDDKTPANESVYNGEVSFPFPGNPPAPPSSLTGMITP